jgi:hypothetical protein
MHNKIIEELSADIKKREVKEKSSLPPVPGRVFTSSQSADKTDKTDKDIDNLLDIPWFLDRRETNPRREEYLAFRKELDARAKIREASRPVPPKVVKPKEVSPYQRKLQKRKRLAKAKEIILANIDKGQTLSGRKLKARFLSAIDGGNPDIAVETDYERAIRRLHKERRICKTGRSYERIK